MTTFIKIGATSYSATDYEVPSERTFREGWEANAATGVISVNMTKAKEIWRDKLRQERKPRMEALDVEYMKALEAGTGAAEIAAQKQTLRDITNDSRIDAATTPDELAALDLATLLGE